MWANCMVGHNLSSMSISNEDRCRSVSWATTKFKHKLQLIPLIVTLRMLRFPKNVSRGGKMKSLIFTKWNCLAKVSGRSGSGCNHVFPERWKTIIEAIMGFNHDHSRTWSLGASAANTGSWPTGVWQQLLFSCDYAFFGARPIFYRDGGSPHTRLNQTGECY